MKNKIWLSSPHMGGGEQKYVQDAFNTNWIAPLGPNVTHFENDLKNYLDQDIHLAALSSGTAALHLALILAGVSKNDVVICQSMTFSASANPIVYQGATPIFIDSEIDTWNMCPIFLESAIKDQISKGKKPKAIIVVHLYGMPAKIDIITQIASKYNIVLIEDAAEALGSKFEGQKCGTFGDFSILSFNGNKIITTSGGGALVTKTKALKEKAVFLATQARDDAPHYQHSEIGYNYRMSNVLAGIGRGQMEVLNSHVEARRGHILFYKSIFKDIKGITVFEAPNGNYFSNCWLSCIIIDENVLGFNREDLRLHLISKNIESRPLWKPMHMQPVFKNNLFYGTNVSETLFTKGLCLPSGSNLTTNESAYISKIIGEYLNSFQHISK